ncbi:MAG: plasmid stabilization protein [Candidatus Accumulibacter necessarius]|jgi:mRNA-degrading endonuclease YafQ of YafQ-DinJ toxin-antitoxin module|uniref:plasmid stabilization protein n=1 Tax=Candidatus Accumulibacter necessarius TaxID=2954386 RepID=UPI002FC3A082
MSWKLVTTVSLDRRTRKLLARHPDLRPRFADTLEKLPTDPFAPGLRLHPLTGKLQGMQEGFASRAISRLMPPAS